MISILKMKLKILIVAFPFEPKVVLDGDVTIVATSIMVLEAKRAAKLLEKKE